MRKLHIQYNRHKLKHEYTYSYDSHCVEYNKWTKQQLRSGTKKTLFAILHEQGHAERYKKMSGSQIARQRHHLYVFKNITGRPSNRIIFNELIAWAYVFKCIKPKEHRYLKRRAFLEFFTYLDHLPRKQIEDWLILARLIWERDYMNDIYGLSIEEYLFRQGLLNIRGEGYYGERSFR